MGTSGNSKPPLLALILFIFAMTLALDFVAANIYTMIFGYSWASSRASRAVEVFAAHERIERTYRIQSPVYHHDLAKKRCTQAFWGDISYKHCTNSLGFRDSAPRDVPLVSDRHRIVFMGDSFTEGGGVDYEDSFVGLIGSALSKKGIEVLNASVMSYSPTIYWKKTQYLLEKVGLKFDEMVVFIDISDIEDEAMFYCLDEFGRVVGYDARNNRDGAPPVPPPPARSVLANLAKYFRNNSILLYSFYHYSRSWLHHDVSSPGIYCNIKRSLWTVDPKAYAEFGEKGLKKCDLYMDKLYALLKRHNIKLTVAVYPWPDQILAGDLNSLQVSHWRAWCLKRNVPFLNYFPYFVTGKTISEKQNVIDQYCIRGDYHWNKAGHRLIADIFLKR